VAPFGGREASQVEIFDEEFVFFGTCTTEYYIHGKSFLSSGAYPLAES
jgi:hypothetical protein